MPNATQSSTGASQRAEAQRDRLLDAAAEVFLQHGFGITTVDIIAAHAKASKKTLYSYFSSKQDIFVAVLQHLCQRALAPLHELEIENEDPEALLVEFGTRLLALVLSPQAIATHRVAISEAPRFPDLARLFYRTGPAIVQRLLSERLAALKNAGKLKIDDPDDIASLYIQMILGDAQRKATMAMCPPPTADEARRHSSKVAKLLLQALGGHLISKAGR